MDAVLPVLAEVVRSGFVESRHRGSLVVLHSDGTVRTAVGDITAPIFPRSSNKPLQTVGMLRAGLGDLDLAEELLALVSASHSGEPFHVKGVRRVLRHVDLDETALRCPPARPLSEPDALATADRSPARIWMNCSGKHAGMLATCVAAGWPIETYLEPEHPLQVRIRDTICDLTGEKVAHVGVDGCGAPLFAFGLTGLARAYRALMRASPGSDERRVVDAVRTNPTWTSGTTRADAALTRGVPGLFCKGGAEGCHAVALPDGRAVALKLEDGAQRAVSVVMAAALRGLGISADVLDEQATSPVFGGRAIVGEIRATALP